MTDPSQTPQSYLPLTKIGSIIKYVINEWKWAIVAFALKALAVTWLWNHFLTPLALPELQFGQVFAITLIIHILFSNLNGYSRHQMNYLFDIKILLQNLLQITAIQAYTRKYEEIVSNETDDVDTQ